MGHTKEQLLSLLQELKIEFSQYEHPVVLTVEEQAKYIGHMNGALTKNLFLKDKKQRFYIVSALAETKVDLKVLSQRLGLGKGSLRMAPEEALAEIIQVPLGCVTPFSLVNESARNVSLLLDQRLKSQEYCFFHPLCNDMSIALKSHDLDKFLNSIGKPLAYVDLEANPTVGKDQPPKAVKSSDASEMEKSRAAANSPIAFADPDKFVEEILEKTVSTALSGIKQHIEKDQEQLSTTISNHMRKQLGGQLKFISTQSHGIYPLQSSGIQSNESRRASVDTSDSDKGTETPSSIPNSQFFPFSSQIEFEKITLNQANETGHESDGNHSKRTMWTVADDKLLATAYTIISENTRVGNCQKGESFWKRIVAYYNTSRDKGAKKRTAEKAKTHWGSVKRIVNRYNGIYNEWYSDRPNGWSDEDLMMNAHEKYKSTYHTAFQYEHVWRIVKDNPTYAPQSFGDRAAKKARTSESSGVHTDLCNPNTTVNVDDSEAQSPLIRQKATKRKDKEKVTKIEEPNQILQHSLALLDEYYKNKKVDQLFQAHQLLVMDTRDMADEQLQNHKAICEQIKKALNI